MKPAATQAAAAAGLKVELQSAPRVPSSFECGPSEEIAVETQDGSPSKVVHVLTAFGARREVRKAPQPSRSRHSSVSTCAASKKCPAQRKRINGQQRSGRGRINRRAQVCAWRFTRNTTLWRVSPACSRRWGVSSVLTARSRSFEQVVRVIRDDGTDGETTAGDAPAAAASESERPGDPDAAQSSHDVRSLGSLASQLQASDAFAQRRVAGSPAVFE